MHLTGQSTEGEGGLSVGTEDQEQNRGLDFKAPQLFGF